MTDTAEVEVDMSAYNTFSEQKSNVVYIYNPSDSSTMESCRDAVCRKIKAKYGDVRFQIVDRNVSVGQAPLVILCHNYSRIGTDIDHATAGLQCINCEHAAIVVIHTKALHALPYTMPTDNLTDENHTKYGKLVDLAFTNEGGLYGCNMNFVGEGKLVDFLDHYMERQTRSLSTRDVPIPCSDRRVPLQRVLLALLGFVVAVALIVVVIEIVRNTQHDDNKNKNETSVEHVTITRFTSQQMPNTTQVPNTTAMPNNKLMSNTTKIPTAG